MLYPVAVKVILKAAVGFFLRVVWHMDWDERIQPFIALEHTGHTHHTGHTTQETHHTGDTHHTQKIHKTHTQKDRE